MRQVIVGAVIVMACFAHVCAAPQDFAGSVVGIKADSWWGQGPLTVVDIPTMAARELVGGECMGPCFSPNGQRIAFVKNGQVMLINSDGSALPEATGILIPQTDGFAYPVLYWLALNNEMGDGEYIYWSRRNHEGSSGAEGMFRCKLGVAVDIESIFTGAYGWAGFSADGKKAMGYRCCSSVYCIDLVEQRVINSFEGDGGNCNPSLSPDGLKFAMLLGVPYDQEILSIHSWSNGDSLKKFTSACVWDAPRWSHSDPDIIVGTLSKQWGGKSCPNVFSNSATISQGQLLNYTTEELLEIPEFVPAFSPWDFHRIRITGSGATVNSPDFSPARSELIRGDTTIVMSTTTLGASISYTTDGSTPTATRGTIVASNTASARIALNPGDTITFKVLAFKAGSTSSPVRTMKYWCVTQPIVMIEPIAGSIHRIGDSLLIRWQADPTLITSSLKIQISLDDGLSFENLAVQILPNTPQWGAYKWRIPTTFGGRTTVTDSAIVRVDVYNFPMIGSNSGRFRIRNAATGVDPISSTSLLPAGKKFSAVQLPDGRGIVFGFASAGEYVTIHAVNGSEICTVRGNTGNKSVTWNYLDKNGRKVISGLYLGICSNGESLKFTVR